MKRNSISSTCFAASSSRPNHALSLSPLAASARCPILVSHTPPLFSSDTHIAGPGILEDQLKADAGGDPMPVYCASKFVQLLGAHWWRRQLTGVCTVVAVSPGMIPGTGLGGGLVKIPDNVPDAKPVAEG